MYISSLNNFWQIISALAKISFQYIKQKDMYSERQCDLLKVT